MDIIKTQDAISTYFNTLLKNSLNYGETYSIIFDYDNLRLTLTPSLQNADLIKQIILEDINNIKYNSKIKHKIEQSLLRVFENINSDISNINLYIIKNKIILTISQSDKLFCFPEEIILAKLLSEYDINKLNDLCRINKNFYKASRSDLFWWEIIKCKFPEYYKDKTNYSYNPRELIKGLSFYDKKINNIVTRLYVDTFNTFYINYSTTFRYLILEDIWNNSDYEMQEIIETMIHFKKSIDNDIEIIKKLLIQNPIFIEDLYNYQEIFTQTMYGFKLALALDKWLISINRDQILKVVDFDSILYGQLFHYSGSDDPEYYEFLYSKLNNLHTDKIYLEEYYESDENHVILKDYILSKISIDIDKDFLVRNIKYYLENDSDPSSFKKIYRHFIKKWTTDDKNVFKILIINKFKKYPDTIIKLLKIL